MVKIMYIRNGKTFVISDRGFEPSVDVIVDLLRNSISVGDFIGKYVEKVRHGKGSEDLDVDTEFRLDGKYIVMYDDDTREIYFAFPLEKSVYAKDLMKKEYENALFSLAKIVTTNYASVVVALLRGIAPKHSFEKIFTIPLRRRLIEKEKDVKVPFDSIVNAICEVDRRDSVYLQLISMGIERILKHRYEKLFEFLYRLAMHLRAIARTKEYDIFGLENELKLLETNLEAYEDLIEWG